jgi:hypothetical protein
MEKKDCGVAAPSVERPFWGPLIFASKSAGKNTLPFPEFFSVARARE